MSDEEVRGNVLRKIYELSPVDSAAITGLGLDSAALTRHLTDLHNLNFIRMNALRAQDESLTGAMVKLTVQGTRSILHPETAPSQVTIIGQVGHRITQEVKGSFAKVQATTGGSMKQEQKKHSLLTPFVTLIKWFLPSG